MSVVRICKKGVRSRLTKVLFDVRYRCKIAENKIKCTFFEEKAKKICIIGKKVVPLHDFSRIVGSSGLSYLTRDSSKKEKNWD